MDSLMRDKILQTAQGLFIQRGYNGLSMRAIAEQVGVSKAALYYYFEDKQQLFLAILEASLAQVENLIDEITAQGGSSQARLELFVFRILDQPADQRAVIRLASQEVAQLDMAARAAFEADYQTRFLDKISYIFDEGIQAGELRPLDSNLMTWALLGMLYPYFYTANVLELPRDEVIARQLLTIFFDGVSLNPVEFEQKTRH